MNLDDASDVLGYSLPRPIRKRQCETVRIGAVFCADADYTFPFPSNDDDKNGEVKVVHPKD